MVDYFHRPPHRPGAPALEVAGLRTARLRDVSLEVRDGEILGLAGLVGSGRSALARALFGIDPIEAGDVRVGVVPVRITRPRDALDVGLVLVPKDRERQGLVMIRSVAFNLALPWADEWNPDCRPDRRKRAAIVGRAVRGFGIRAADPGQPVRSLSGGNQQKVLVGRWM